MKAVQILFSAHAETKLQERRISKALVRKTVQSPDLAFPSYSNRERAYKKFGKNYLAVVFIREKGAIVVITQHWIAKLKTEGE